MAVELLAAYLRENERRNLSKTTVEDRRRLLGRYITSIEPLTPLTVTQADVERWIDTLGVGPRSRYSYLSMIAGFHEWLEDTGHRVDNPARRIRRPKLGRLLPRPIDTDDLGFLLSISDPRMRCWIALASYAGLRCAEIAALSREDVMLDHDPPLLRVNQGKGGKDRIVPLAPIVEDALRAYGLRSGRLFRLNNDRPISANTLSCYIARWMKAQGVEASAHRGRHHFGTAAYRESGGDLRLVQELLGHASPLTTAGYAAFDPVRAAEVVRRLGKRAG